MTRWGGSAGTSHGATGMWLMLLRDFVFAELPESWADMQEPLLEGMCFTLKYLGMTLVEKPKGEDMAAAAIRRIVATVRAALGPCCAGVKKSQFRAQPLDSRKCPCPSPEPQLGTMLFPRGGWRARGWLVYACVLWGKLSSCRTVTAASSHTGNTARSRAVLVTAWRGG